MPGSPLVEALRTAVAADPDRVSVRVELARTLLEEGESEEALLHARAALARAPDDTAALAAAATAAEASGDAAAAASFARLHAALGAHARDVPEPVWSPGGPDDEPAPEAEPADTVRLADVGGMTEVKRRLELSFLAPIRDAGLGAYYGNAPHGGLLLYGPPGCGKTFLARALAGELGAGFVDIGLSDVLDMWFGNSERNLHDLFTRARDAAPCVLFLDELDALGHKRSQLRGSAGRTLVNQLLSELDGVGSRNAGVFVLAATNHPWDVDGALRRPGRFDRTLLVLPPDGEARRSILAGALRGRPVADLDLDRVVRDTERYSGADLTLLVETAAELALEDALRTGDRQPINARDLERARKQTEPSTLEWFRVAYNYAAFANDGGRFDELLQHIHHHRLA